MTVMEISIVTPAYNAAKYLEQTIASVNSQSFDSYEWLICDDGSTDETSDILRKAATENPHIRVFTQSNKGVSSARNHCLTEVHGKYLMFLDADDALGDGCLRILWNQMEATHPDICFYGWYIHKGNDLYSYFFENREIFSSTEDRYQMILTDPYLCGGGYPWNKIWRVSSITEKAGSIPLFNTQLRHYEDKLWTLQLLDLMDSPRVYFYNEPLYHYYMREESLSHALTPEGFSHLADDTIASLDQITDYVSKHHPGAASTAAKLRQSKLQEIISIIREYEGS